MTEERFGALAEAYGGDVSRWPADQREAAAMMMAADPDFTRDVLTRASMLDAALDSWTREPVSSALAERILAQAPSAQPAPRWRGWLMPAGLGAGLAAAGVAGLLAGLQYSGQAVGGEDSVAAVIAALDPTSVAEEV